MTTSDPETRALVVADQRTVRLDDEGTDIVAVRVEDGSIYVPIRPLCAALGLDASGQIQRIHRREALAEMVRTIAVPTAGGTQDLACLHVEGVPLWLSGIDTSRIKEGLRQKFVHFQRWARTRIAEAFLTETGIGPVRDDMASVVPARPDTSALDQIESFGLALAAFAREQRAFELRYAVEQQAVQGELAQLDREVGRLDGRLDRAASTAPPRPSPTCCATCRSGSTAPTSSPMPSSPTSKPWSRPSARRCSAAARPIPINLSGPPCTSTSVSRPIAASKLPSIPRLCSGSSPTQVGRGALRPLRPLRPPAPPGQTRPPASHEPRRTEGRVFSGGCRFWHYFKEIVFMCRYKRQSRDRR